MTAAHLSAPVASPRPRSHLCLPQSRRDRVRVIAFAILLAICGVATGWLFVFPATVMPPKVDAIVASGGPGKAEADNRGC